MRRRLEEAQASCKSIPDTTGKFSVRELPLFSVQETLPSVSAFKEYQDRVLRFLDLEQEDILSSLVRAISFDETGLKGSEMYVVKPAVEAEGNSVFLEHGRCLYTAFIADNNDPSIPEKMFALCFDQSLSVSHSLILPSSMRMIRSASCAMASLCVIIMVV